MLEAACVAESRRMHRLKSLRRARSPGALGQLLRHGARTVC